MINILRAKFSRKQSDWTVSNAKAGKTSRAKKAILGVCIAAGLNTGVNVQQLYSANGEIFFSADVTSNNPCFIFVRNEGTLVANTELTQLSSQLPGGVSGIVDIFAIFPYQIWVDAPPFFFSEPVGVDGTVSVNTFYSGQALNTSGVTFGQRPGNVPIRFPRFFGQTRLTVDLEANRPNPFPAGDYSSTATVRCE